MAIAPSLHRFTTSLGDTRPHQGRWTRSGDLTAQCGRSSAGCKPGTVPEREQTPVCRVADVHVADIVRCDAVCIAEGERDEAGGVPPQAARWSRMMIRRVDARRGAVAVPRAPPPG